MGRFLVDQGFRTLMALNLSKVNRPFTKHIIYNCQTQSMNLAMYVVNQYPGS